MSIEEVEAELTNSPYFFYRGAPEVSFAPDRFRELFEVDGSGFIERGIFQFFEDSLYSITLIIRETRMDHFSLYTQFVERYGEPSSLDPRESLWEIGGRRLSLERPLTVRYLDLVRFDELRQEENIEESIEELSREAFLGEF